MKTLIMGALDEEVDGLIAALQNGATVRAGAFTAHCGTLGRNELVVCRCGIGKVNAAAATAAILTAIPDIGRVINTGVAGGIDPQLCRGDVVIGVQTVQHDFDSTADGLQKGQVAGFDEVFFSADPALVADTERALAAEHIDYRKGIVASGDQFIASNEKAEELRKAFGASACEMESAAIAQVCALFGVPFLALRSISDNGGDNAVMSFYEFLHIAAQKNIRAIKRMME